MSDFEEIMKKWDKVYKYIIDGGRGSYPRDFVESIVDQLIEIDQQLDAKQQAIEEAINNFISIHQDCNSRFIDPPVTIIKIRDKAKKAITALTKSESK